MMKTLVYFILLVLFHSCTNSHKENTSIAETTVYYHNFDWPSPYGEYYDEEIKEISSTIKYIDSTENFKKELKEYLYSLDTTKNYVDLTGALYPDLLIEIKYNNDSINRIYSWNDGRIFYGKKEFKPDLRFI